MLESMRKTFARWALELAYRSDPALRAPMTPEPARPAPGGGFHAVGLHDLKRTGWFNDETAELCKGFAIAPGDTVVDVGCGNGVKTQFCARFAEEIIAIDIDAARVEDTLKRMRSAARARFTVRAGTADAIPVDCGVADKVICSEVLEHVDDPGQVLQELFRIGKPGAVYLLSVPDARSEAVAKRLAPPFTFRKPFHIHIFTSDDFERLVTAAGFIVQSHTYQGFFMGVCQALLWRSGPGANRQAGTYGPAGSHSVLNEWAQAWSTLLDLPKGQDCKEALDDALPKSQVIIAVKPSAV